MSIQERIETAVVQAAIDLQKPAKCYLGKREFKTYNKELTSKRGYLPPVAQANSASNQLAVVRAAWVKSFELEIVPTKHKSYFRVV
jgi:hypothetical protein